MTDEMTRGVGQALATARQAKGLTVETVAEKLKLTVRQVEAIEAEDFGHLPAPVFVRGFVRNYARLLGLEANDLLASLDVEQKPTETLTAPSEGVKFGSSPMRRWLLIPLLFLLLFMTLVAGLYAWLSQGEDALVTPELVAPAPVMSEQVIPVQPGVPAVEVAPAPASPDAPIPQAPASTAPEAPTPAGPQAPTPPAGLAAPQTGANTLPVAKPPARPGANGATLRFRVEDDSWIQVVDGAGQRYSRLIRAGSSETLQGKPPFKLVVGNAALVKLEYNDHVIDLTPFIGEKVARLTLE